LQLINQSRDPDLVNRVLEVQSGVVIHRMNQLHRSVPFRLVQRQPIGSMPPHDHQAVPRCHRIGIGDAQLQFVLQQYQAAGLQRSEHIARLAPSIMGLHAAEVGATSCIGKQSSCLSALQRKQRV